MLPKCHFINCYLSSSFFHYLFPSHSFNDDRLFVVLKFIWNFVLCFSFKLALIAQRILLFLNSVTKFGTLTQRTNSFFVFFSVFGFVIFMCVSFFCWALLRGQKHIKRAGKHMIGAIDFYFTSFGRRFFSSLLLFAPQKDWFQIFSRLGSHLFSFFIFHHLLCLFVCLVSLLKFF